jgi:catechol 2,3-dioxygenase-like lactoylglutathione lyase family enzyme
MRRRDHIDSNRKVAPLRPAEDALILDSDYLDADQVLGVVLHWIQTGAGAKPALSGQIAGIMVLADDLPAMLRFYRDILGFKPLNELDDTVEFEHAGVRFTLRARLTMAQATRHPSYRSGRAGQAFALALEVGAPAEVDRVYADLLARGAAPVCPPADLPWGRRSAFFGDPEGNIHEVFASLPARP